MAKEFRVEGRHDDARATRGLLVFPKPVDDEGCEVLRVGLRAFLRGHRIVGNLFGQGDAPVRDPPVSKAVPPVLAVKFQVGAVSGISVIGAPDLDAGPRVPREDRYLPPTGRRYGVRFVRRKARSLASGIESSFRESVFVSTDRSSSGDEVGVDEEVPEALSGQELLEPGSKPRSCRADRTRPSVSWAVGAFREPNAARSPSESTAVARDADPQLGLDRLIPAQEGQVSVGRSGHDDFDSTTFLQTHERGEQVSIVLLEEVLLGALIELGPGDRGAPGVFVARSLELSPVRVRAACPFPQVRQEPIAEPRCRQHLGEDGGHAQRDGPFTILGLEASQEPEDRKVALGRGFVEPRFPVGPAAMAEDPW